VRDLSWRMGADREMAQLAFLNVYLAVEINQGGGNQGGGNPGWEEQTARRVSDSGSETIREEWMAD